MSKNNVRVEIKKSIKVDSLIANSIKILNEKGYTTKFCCSGHPDELYKYENGLYHLGSYVTFEHDTFKLLTEIKNIPNNWTCNEIGIYRFFEEDEVNIFKPENLISMAMKELEEWANNLPENMLVFMYDTEIDCDIDEEPIEEFELSEPVIPFLYTDFNKLEMDIKHDDNIDVQAIANELYERTKEQSEVNKKYKWNKDSIVCKLVFEYLLKEVEQSEYLTINSDDYDKFNFSKYLYNLFEYLNEKATELDIVNPSDLVEINEYQDSILFEYNNKVYLISRFDGQGSFITLSLYASEYTESMLRYKDKILVY